MTKKEHELTKAIADEILKLPFGGSPALPWCRESFPELDRLLKEYEKIKKNKKFNLFINGNFWKTITGNDIENACLNTGLDCIPIRTGYKAGFLDYDRDEIILLARHGYFTEEIKDFILFSNDGRDITITFEEV